MNPLAVVVLILLVLMLLGGVPAYASNESAKIVSASMPPLPGATPTLLRHVGAVVGMSAEKQVARVAAEPVIAVVTNEFASGNGAKSDLPHDAVDAPWPAIYGDYPITVGACTTRPIPALIGGAPIKLGVDTRSGRCRRAPARSALDRAVPAKPIAFNTFERAVVSAALGFEYHAATGARLRSYRDGIRTSHSI